MTESFNLQTVIEAKSRTIKERDSILKKIRQVEEYLLDNPNNEKVLLKLTNLKLALNRETSTLLKLISLEEMMIEPK